MENIVNGRNGVASLIQVIASSTMETDHLYGNECDSFKQSYVQHTKFDKESVAIDKGLVDISGDTTLIYNIPSLDTDIIGNLFLRFDLPSVAKEYKWVNSVGHRIVKEVKLVLGDYEIVTYSGKYLHARMLTTTSASHYHGRCQMIGCYNSKYSLNNKARICFVEIPFLKSAIDQQLFPLFMSKGLPLQLFVKLRPVNELVCNVDENKLGITLNVNELVGDVRFSIHNSVSISDMKVNSSLYYDHFKITAAEKQLFRGMKSEILFAQVQENIFRFNSDDRIISDTFKLRGNVFELIIFVKPDTHIDNGMYFNFFPLSGIKLNINGVPIVNDQTTVSADMYRLKQSNIRTPKRNIYVISFGLSPQSQPSGSINFTKMNSNNKITLERDTHLGEACNVYMYALYYNTLMISNDGIGLKVL